MLATRCRDCYVSANGRLVVALGVEGVVIVETGDAVLVMSKDEATSAAQNVKQVVDEIAKGQRPA